MSVLYRRLPVPGARLQLGGPPATPEAAGEPYDPEWNRVHSRGTTEKCIFCPALIRKGKLPACVAACPMGALYFGDAEEDAVTNS